METLKVNFAVLMLFMGVLFSNLTFAAEYPTSDDDDTPKITATQKFAYNVYAYKNGLKFKVAFKNATEEVITIQIIDQKGNTIHKDVLRNQEQLNRDYNMEKIGAGIYTVKIKMGDLEAENQVALGVSDKSIDKTFQAYVSPVIKEDAVQVFYKNGSQGVSISFTDDKGNIIYQENTSDDEMYAKKYNISKLKKGIYILTLTSGNRTIEKIYNVQ